MSNLWVETDELGIYADSDYAYDAVKTASYMLWAMSGRKFSGTTTVTERYVSMYDPYLRTGASHLNYSPTLINGQVENLPQGGFGIDSHHDYQGDGTSSYSRVRLRGRKVVRVHALRTGDGDIVDSSTYYLADHSTIYGTPNATWTPSNVEVTYTYGSPPPVAGRAAARMLAIELVKLYEGDDTCALPQRVTSVSRQGVTYTVLDSQDFIDDLRTGVYAIDLFLKTVNPDKARARSRVFSPDTPRARRIVGQAPAFELSAFDLYFNQEGGTVVYYLDELNADFLTEDNAWTVSTTVSNYTNTISTVFETAAVLDRVEGTIRLSLNYSQLLPILGTRDPGILDLYATRPSLGNPEVDEVINLLTSNVIYQLGNPVTPIALPQRRRQTMALPNVTGVSNDAKNLANLMQDVLNRVITVYESYDMPLPARRYWNIATPAVDCEQLVVSMIQMYVGTPGDEATEPRRCNDPRSVTLNISVSRSVPILQNNGQPPLADDIQEAAVVAAYDAWILMESINQFDSWATNGPYGMGVIATVDSAPPEGGYQTTRMTITMAVP